MRERKWDKEWKAEVSAGTQTAAVTDRGRRWDGPLTASRSAAPWDERRTGQVREPLHCARPQGEEDTGGGGSPFQCALGPVALCVPLFMSYHWKGEQLCTTITTWTT